MSEITREQFETVCRKHIPSGFLKFVYLHYNVKLMRTPRPIGTWLGVIGWSAGTIGLILFNELGMRDVALKFIWLYIPFFAFLVTLPAFFMARARIKRIVKELGLTITEYNNLVEKLYS